MRKNEARENSMWGNLAYCFREMWKWNRTFFFCCVFGFVPAVLGNFLGVCMPARVVADLEAKRSLDILLLTLGALWLGIWACNMACGMLQAYVDNLIWSFVAFLQKKYIRKIMDVDYDRLESRDRQKVLGNVADSVNRGRGLVEIGLFTHAIESILLTALYGGLLCMENPLLTLAVAVTVFVDLRILAYARKRHNQYHEDLGLQTRRMNYINIQAQSAAAGKDVRVYKLADWLLGKYEETMKEMDKTNGRIMVWYTNRLLIGALFGFLRNLFVYAWLLWQLVRGQVSADDFVFYVGLVNGLANNFETVMRQIMNFGSTGIVLGRIRQFLGWEDRWRRGEGIGAAALEKLLRKPVSLELRDLSFTYPGGGKPTLSHLNLTIRPGERLALLGLNGAGKTTLVKLICGFYHPTEGQILINGIPQETFSRDEYERIMSVLFQDHTLLPITLDENLTGQAGERVDRERLDRVLSLSGFRERYESLPRRGETKLVKEANEGAAEFSGGEKQKLLFARAMYKQAPLLILDEPTAALDPIAENRLYLNFRDATAGATSIYISHRLSSTRFCDRIVLLENGCLAEEGTHEELMGRGGRYAMLFEMQSRYYREEQERDRAMRAQAEAFGDADGKGAREEDAGDGKGAREGDSRVSADVGRGGEGK